MNEEQKQPRTLRDRLEDERWELMNSYGRGPVIDGAISLRIQQIDAMLGLHQ